MINLEDTIKVEQITLEKIRVANQISLSPSVMHDMRVETMQQVAGDLMMRISTQILSQSLVKDEYTVQETKKIAYPKGWFQHFKADVMPSWFIKRFPVKHYYEEVHFKRVVKIDRRETYPMSSLVTENNHHFMNIMGTPVIRDIVEGL